jgi:glucosamine 6-phosphate synthetase-like amidotransferase/phosphosugar isomerase protein
MCGIVAYVGRKEAEPILIDGLRRLEYRGYDSAGLVTLAGSDLHLRKRAASPKNTSRPITSSTSAASSSSPSPWKARSYIHAEGYPAAEMKHGPIALVDSDTPSVFLIPRGAVFEKIMSNLQEIKARGGPTIAIACEGDEEVAAQVDDVMFVPEVPEYLQPLVTVVPLQLLAYHIALLRGCDVDKPRNLAKSVTVE